MIGMKLCESIERVGEKMRPYIAGEVSRMIRWLSKSQVFVTRPLDERDADPLVSGSLPVWSDGVSQNRRVSLREIPGSREVIVEVILPEGRELYVCTPQGV